MRPHTPYIPWIDHCRIGLWVGLFNCLHCIQVFLTSASKSRRQVFLGRPLFLFPLWFPKTCWVLLLTDLQRVWPIYLQRLCRISCSTGIWHVRCHNRCLLKVSGHQTASIFLRQLLTNACIGVSSLWWSLWSSRSLFHKEELPWHVYWKSWSCF